MTGENKTLNETISSVLEENQSGTSEAQENETQSDLSEGQSAETKSGETAEYASGVDISDIPEQERPRIKELLEKKAKLLEKGYQPKFQKVAQLEKTLEWLKSEGLSEQEAADQLRSYAQQKKNPVAITDDKKKAVRTLDKLLSEAPYEQKQALEQMRTIILEETNVSDLKKKVEDLEKVIGFFSTSANQSRQKEVNLELDTTFAKKLGKDFIDKHRDTIVSMAVKYPTASLSKIIKNETPDDEYEQAILANLGKTTRKPLTDEKRNAISSNGQGVSIAKDNIDTKGSWSQTLRDLIKK